MWTVKSMKQGNFNAYLGIPIGQSPGLKSIDFDQ